MSPFLWFRGSPQYLSGIEKCLPIKAFPYTFPGLFIKTERAKERDLLLYPRKIFKNCHFETSTSSVES